MRDEDKSVHRVNVGYQQNTYNDCAVEIVQTEDEGRDMAEILNLL